MTSLRSVVGVLLLIVIGLLVWWGTGPRDADGLESVDQSAGPDVATDDELADAGLANDAREVVAASEPSDATVPSAPVEAVDPPDARVELEFVELDGTMVVRDPEGFDHFVESGSGVVMVGLGNRATIERVDVIDGRWSLAVPTTARLGFRDFVLGDRPAYFGADARSVPIPADGRVTVRAQWGDAVALRVLDAVTRADLGGVEVRALVDVDAFAGTPSDPGARSRVLAESAFSPIELEPTPGVFDAPRTVVYARAPGYAWGHKSVDPSGGREYELLLHPGGGLDIVLVGDTVGTHLWVYEEYETWIRTSPVYSRVDAETRALLLDNSSGQRGPLAHSRRLEGEQRVALDAVRAGTYEVLVGLGDYVENAQLLGEATVQVFAGQRSEVVVDVVPLPEVFLVPLRGELVMPPEWGLGDSPFLIFELIDEVWPGQRASSMPDLRRVPGSEDRFTFDGGEVQPGRFVASVSQLLHTVAFEVGPDGATDLLIEFPPPAEVVVEVVEVVDEISGGDAGATEIMWKAVGAQGITANMLQTVAVDPESGRFVFFTAPGEIEVVPVGAGWQSEPQRFQVVGGTNAFTLEARRGIGLRIVLMDGDTVVPFGGFAALVQAAQVDGDGVSTETYARQLGLEMAVSAPGLYGVQVPAVDGYLPIPLQQIRVEAGSFVEHVVQLVRE